MTRREITAAANTALLGKRFGRLVVASLDGVSGGWDRRWRCVCDCGTEKVVKGWDMKSGHTSSCGCLRRERSVAHGRTINRTHSRTKTPEYVAWRRLKSRCSSPGDASYYRYGGRGIRVCPEWAESFEAFYADMGDRQSPRHSIDRIDNEGNYEPGNCRWATKREQSRNRCNNRVIAHGGVAMVMAEWAERVGFTANTIASRLQRGWSVGQALGREAR